MIITLLLVKLHLFISKKVDLFQSFCIYFINSILNWHNVSTVQRRPLKTCLRFLCLKMWQKEIFLLTDLSKKAAHDLLQ